MTFQETALAGVFVIDPERVPDERGFFARTFAHDLFAARGLATAFAQCSVSFNHRAGTLRGMHFQAPPHDEIELIRCTAGAAYDVALDLRPDSATYRQWMAVELSAENRRMVYLPAGIAHGFQTLVDETELFYQISVPYHAPSSRGVRWDDPAFAIAWPPAAARVISERDRAFADFVA